jgi:SAM-dependent methyltransferase
MFEKTARFYDLIYTYRDVGAEAAAVQSLVKRYKQAPGRRILDVACGTGAHLAMFQQHFDHVEGLDLDPGMLAVARERFPDLPVHELDMIDFHLGRPFDVITCLFSSIGYVATVERLRQVIATVAGHLAPCGVLIVEPWLMRGEWEDDHVGVLFVNEPACVALRNREALLQVPYCLALGCRRYHFFPRSSLSIWLSKA